MSRHPGASHPNTPGSQHLGHGTPGSQHLGHNTPGSQHLGHGTPGSQHLGHGTPGSQHGSQQARSHHGPSSHHGSQVTRISFFGQNHLFYICSTDHCTVLSTGAATVSPRLGSLLQEPPTHPHITLQMQVIFLLFFWTTLHIHLLPFIRLPPRSWTAHAGKKSRLGGPKTPPRPPRPWSGLSGARASKTRLSRPPGPLPWTRAPRPVARGSVGPTRATWGPATSSSSSWAGLSARLLWTTCKRPLPSLQRPLWL